MPPISVELGPFRDYMQARCAFLKSIDCPTSCRDPLAEFSEWLVAKQLSGTLAASRVQKGFDLVRPDGQRVQVKYLANPTSKWINEHHVKFSDETDEYALVIFAAFELIAVVVFRRETIAAVCSQLQKRHPEQDQGLQFTHRNFLSILDNPASFEPLGVIVFRP